MINIIILFVKNTFFRVEKTFISIFFVVSVLGATDCSVCVECNAIINARGYTVGALIDWVELIVPSTVYVGIYKKNVFRKRVSMQA